MQQVLHCRPGEVQQYWVWFLGNFLRNQAAFPITPHVPSGLGRAESTAPAHNSHCAFRDHVRSKAPSSGRSFMTCPRQLLLVRKHHHETPPWNTNMKHQHHETQHWGGTGTGRWAEARTWLSQNHWDKNENTAPCVLSWAKPAGCHPDTAADPSLSRLWHCWGG